MSEYNDSIYNGFMAKIVSMTKFRKDLEYYLEYIKDHGEIIITRYGRAIAKVIPVTTQEEDLVASECRKTYKLDESDNE